MGVGLANTDFEGVRVAGFSVSLSLGRFVEVALSGTFLNVTSKNAKKDRFLQFFLDLNSATL